MLRLNVNNETSRLKAVVLGIGNSLGSVPTANECYDPKSRFHVLNRTYPTEIDIIHQLDFFNDIFLKYKIRVFRPSILKNVNQIFSRDIGFVIGDKFFISNTIKERSKEIEGLKSLFKKLNFNNIVYFPKNCRVEGGDIILHNEYIFIGTSENNKFDNFKTARTNVQAVNFIKQYFPEKKIISFPLVKSDTDYQKLALHLDCCFQPVGKNKLVICPDAFLYEEDYNWILNNFKKENIFEISLAEMSQLKCNFFSISQNIVISEISFSRLNNWLRSNGITVEEINYNEISKQGGLFRCSTLPLIRE
tara:strand:- start:947 stop:1861 length:915 start_codon:yes stop_codon:yes gene_type:complete